MKILLDTHTALWWVNEHEKLSPTAIAVLLDDSNTLYLSIISLWEIAIKTSLGKLMEFDGGVCAFMAKVNEMPVQLLSIEPHHIKMVEDLPYIHRDPFDRLLIAIANTEGMAILSADENIHKYDVPSIW